MQKQDREILEIIVSLNQQYGENSVSFTSLFNRLPLSLKKNKDFLLSRINALEHDGYLKARQVERTILVAPTRLGIEKITIKQKSKLLEPWVPLATIIGTLVTIIVLINEFSPKLRNPSDHLIIQSASFPDTSVDLLAEGTSIEVLAEGCIEPNENDCRVVLSASQIGMIPHLVLNVSNRATDTPLLIEGIELELVNFKSVENRSTDLLARYVNCYGGSGPPHKFTIDHFPLGYTIVDLSTDFDRRIPEQAIGTKVMANAICPNGICDTLYVTNEEVESLVLEMPFFEDFPAGWYGFEAAIAYSYVGKHYISTEQIRFDVIKPKKLNSWWLYCEGEPSLSFATVDLEAGEISPSRIPSMDDNPPGTLIFNSNASIDNAFYSLNLQSGELRHVGKLGLMPPIDNQTLKPSPSGWQLAFELSSSNNTDYLNTDIGIVDIKNETYVNITRTDNNQNFFPAWSPTGNKIAYVSFAHVGSQELAKGEGDIFVYDIQEGTTKRVTFTPNIIEEYPVWLSENSLAYLMPDIQPHTAETVPQNSKIGYGIVDLNSGENVFTEIDVGLNPILKFLPNANELLIYGLKGMTAISLTDGSVFEDPLFSGNSCMFLDSLREKFICEIDNDKIVLYDVTESHFEAILEIDRNDIWSNWRNLVIGPVFPGGFAIADLEENRIHEYSEDGVPADTWLVPELNKLLFPYGSSGRNFILIRDVSQ